MKKLLDHLRQDWYKYLLELLVITFGILGAFLLNSWNEDKKMERATREGLMNVLEDLRLDSLQFQFHVRNSERMSVHLNGTIGNLLHQGTDDSLEYNFQRSKGYLVAVVHSSAFQAMNDQGLISNIADAQLRHEIMRYFTYIQLNVVKFREFEYARLESTINQISVDEAIDMDRVSIKNLELDYSIARKVLLEPENLRRLYQYRDTQEFLAERARRYAETNRELITALETHLDK